MTADILVEPGNPLDIRPEHLVTLIDQISSDTGLTVDFRSREQRGFGVTWWEVLYIYVGSKVLDGLTGHTIQLLLDQITGKVKDWISERRKQRQVEYPGRQQRPFILEIKDEDGQILREFEIDPIPPPAREKRKKPGRKSSKKSRSSDGEQQ